MDTNVFVAAFWNKRSASAEILSACREGRLHPFYTHQIQREIFLILRNIKAPESYRREVVNVLENGTKIDAPGDLSVVTEDPEDDKFLECASISGADYLVTNDDHLLRLRHFEGTDILKPSELRRILDEAS